MAVRFVARDTKSGEYLAEKFMRGFYFTEDISQAIKGKTKEEIQTKIDKQTIRASTLIKVDSVNFS